jgi:hypothetical protein
MSAGFGRHAWDLGRCDSFVCPIAEPYLHALRAETMVDGLPRAFM